LSTWCFSAFYQTRYLAGTRIQPSEGPLGLFETLNFAKQAGLMGRL